MSNKRGQVSVEMVMMLMMMVFFAALVMKAMKDNEVIANLVSGPWISVAGLIQNGVWGSPEKTMNLHPNHYNRISSKKGEVPE